jgi:hypothetical protein
MTVLQPRDTAMFETDHDALTFLARYAEISNRSRSELEQQPEVMPLAREALRAQLAEVVKPLLEAKLRVAVLRLQWLLWYTLDDKPPQDLFEIVGGFAKRPSRRATEAAKEAEAAASDLEQLEQHEEIVAAVVLLDVLDRSEQPEGV